MLEHARAEIGGTGRFRLQNLRLRSKQEMKAQIG